MIDPHPIKRIIWIGSSLRNVKSFPDEVKDVIGYALYQSQIGLKAVSVKPLSGFGSASVLEVMEDYLTDTYRAVYTVKFREFIYVLHAFQKKSKKGIATPKRDIDVIRQRLKTAEEDYQLRKAGKK
jgi:phage-related protein